MHSLVFLRSFIAAATVSLVGVIGSGCGMSSVLVDKDSMRGDASTDAALNRCGNGKIEPNLGEFCDGEKLGGATCRSLGYPDGELLCTEDCLIDVTMCGSRTVASVRSDSGRRRVIGDGGRLRPLGDGGLI